MNKKRIAGFISVSIATSLLLSGCQLLTGYQQIENAENADKWAGKIEPIVGEVNIACSGTYHCEIMQVDQTSVIAPDTHKPVDPEMLSVINTDDEIIDRTQTELFVPLKNQHSVKVVPLSASGIAGMTNYYARVKPAKREVHINFYPENNMGYVERFAMIHEFVEPDTYLFRAYRKKPSQDTGSLLDTASPNPLCIDLIQNDTIKRQFCKQMNNESQGEFVETNVINQIKQSTQAAQTKTKV